MAVCDYVYLSGLRAQSGDPVVEVDGVKYRVVRNGKGRSRLDRWEDKPLADGCVGEINLRDLSLKLAETGLDTVTVTVKTPDGSYSTLIKPAEAMGQDGRDGGLKEALEGMTEDERRVALLDQIRTLPIAGTNAEAARGRLDTAFRILRVGDLRDIDLDQAVISVLTEQETTFLLSHPSFVGIAHPLADTRLKSKLEQFWRWVDKGGPSIKNAIDCYVRVNASDFSQTGRGGKEASASETLISIVAFDEFNVAPLVALDYLEAGADSYEYLSDLVKFKVTPYTTRGMIAAGVKNPEHMSKLTATNLTPPMIKVYVGAGFTTVEDYLQLGEMRLDPPDVLDFSKAGVREPETMLELTKAGIKGSDYLILSESGVGRDEMQSIVSTGVRTALYSHFRDLGFSDTESLRLFAHAGIAPARVREYLDHGVGDAHAIAQLYQAGVTPEHASRSGEAESRRR